MKKYCCLYLSIFFLFLSFCFHANGQANVLLGKSFVNITRPNGGTVVPGDELEIRLSFFVYTGTTNFIYRVRYNDTIPNNLTYVNSSLKLLTNEGVLYKAYTDVGGDDQAMYNSANKTIRFNLGRDTTAGGFSFQVKTVSSTATDTSVGGGYFNRANHRPRAGGGSLGSGMLLLVTYRVTVDASTAYNTIITYGSGALRYRRLVGSGVAGDQYTLNPNGLSFIVYQNYGLCTNATGSNNVTAGNGNFGSGTSQNGTSPGAAVPGYVFGNITASFPGDGSYSVIKNLSPNQLTDPTVARPNTTSGNRVFGVWDIIGYHTNASNLTAGNAPVASGASGGYMLVVNSALQLSVANNQTISGLCEETYYEFSAWFRNVCKRCGSDSMARGASGTSVPAGYLPLPGNDSSGVKPNLTFQINGVDYYTSGNIEYAGTWGEWVKKGFVFKTSAGQTSITISIKNNAPGGGGNDWAMDDIALATCLPALDMRPSNAPTYCLNNQVDISVAVSTFFDNYFYYQWERSTDGGTTWVAAPESPGIQTFTYTNFSGQYRDTVALPSFIANSSYNGYKYRIKVATSLTNLSLGACSVYNSVDIITITVNNACNVLNMRMDNFQALLLYRRAQLKWNAIAEKGNYWFEIERSSNGILFSTIGTIPGGGQTWDEYNFTDAELLNGKKYYRIRMIAENGDVKLSNVLVLSDAMNEQFIISGLVNPFNTEVRFDLHAPIHEIIQLQIVDAVGKTVFTKYQSVSKGYNRIILANIPILSNGMFMLQLSTSRGTFNQQILHGR